MKKNLEEELSIPSPVRTIEYASMKNPLFQKALKQMKDPTEKEAFLKIFRGYLMGAYKSNPKMQRLMKTHNLAEKVAYAPELEEYDERNIIDKQLYSEPGRTYQYANNFLGYERKKRGLLKRLYNTTKDLTFETLPGIVGLGGWYGAKRWNTKRLSEEAVEEMLIKRTGKKALEGFGGAFKNMKWWEYNPLSAGLRWNKGLRTGVGAAVKEVSSEVAGDSLLGIVGAVLNPAKYLLGGYFLYKTIRYFIKKHKEKKELKELNKSIWLQNQMLAQAV